MKIQYTNIDDRLVLYRLTLEQGSPVVAKRNKVNHVVIYDRSGSMWSTLATVVEDIIKHLDKIPDGDTLTAGWFSTEGQFNWIFKGLTVNDNRDQISNALRKNNTTIGLTCFSEILMDTADHVVPDLNNLGGEFKLMFFSDGYPVVSNYSVEQRNIMGALQKLNAVVSSAVLVGYGPYYNKELMTTMSSKIGGSLVHSSKLEQFENQYVEFVTGESLGKRIEVHLPVSNAWLVFGIDGKQVVRFPLEPTSMGLDDWNALVPEKTEVVYLLTDEQPKYRALTEMVSRDSVIEGILGAAYLSVAATNTEQAIDLLGSLGDIRLIDLVTNAWTNEEYGIAQEKIAEAITDPAKRFLKGRNSNYVPDPGAFCLFDALQILADDEFAFFYPSHKAFVYNPIGIPRLPVEGSAKFEREADTPCSFSNLTWNESRLNLSIQAYIPGYVILTGDPASVGLPEKVKSNIFRNYTLIKDGVLNIETLPVSMSEATFDRLQDNGMIDSLEEWMPDMIYTVDFTKIPLVNRNIATAPTAVEFCGWINDALDYEARQKVVNALIKRYDPENATKDTNALYTKEQNDFLEAQGVKSYGFSPKTVQGEVTDFYYAKEFEVKVAKFSSFPKLEDVEAAQYNGKKLTPSQQMMFDQLVKVTQMIDKYVPNTSDNLAVANYLRGYLKDLKKLLNNIRIPMQKTRMAILLAKKWFPDLTTRDGAVVKIGEREFTISIREVKVEY